MLKLQNFWKIPERPGLSEFGKFAFHRDNTSTTGAGISVLSTTRVFLNTVQIPVLCADAACSVRLFRGCFPGPGCCKDHSGPHRTSRTMLKSVCNHWLPPNQGRTHHTSSRGSEAPPGAQPCLGTAAPCSPRPATPPYR